jgi:hypothetical protein
VHERVLDALWADLYPAVGDRVGEAFNGLGEHGGGFVVEDGPQLTFRVPA